MTQHSKILCLAVFVATLLLPVRAAAQGAPPAASDSQQAAKAPKVRLADAYGRLPLSFEANEGQTDRRVKFISRNAGKTLFLTSTEAVLTSDKRSAMRMKLVGASQNAQVIGLDKLPGKSNYFIGNDPAKWRLGLTEYRKVRFRQIYPGVDLVYYGNQQELEYDFVVAPGARPEQIRLTIRGASNLRIDANGNAVLHCVAGDLRMMKPRMYQRIDGREIAVAGGYQLEGHELRFAIAHFNPHQPLIIDPVLSYSTYMGGSGGDGGAALAVDSAGSAYITGFTTSTDFPGIGPGSFQSTPSHLYVSKLNAAGTAIVYSTYLGSSGVDTVNGIAVDPSGNAYVIGYTNGTNFPTTAGAFQQFNHGGYDVFVTKLNPIGSALVYSTYLGGSSDDSGLAIALDSAGNAYLTGQTGSSDFPTAGSSPIQSTNHLLDAFVAKLNATGSALVYSTYLGGSGYDQGQGIAVDSAGNAYVTGRTNSTDFPGTSSSSIQPTKAGPYNAFVTKIDAAGTALMYSTYLGGSNYDYGYGVAVDSAGSAYATGYTSSTNFTGVTSGSLQPLLGSGNGNAYVAKINPAGTGLVYSTYLGGSGGENGTSIATDSSGNAWVTGTTSSTNFPGVNVNSIQSTPGGMIDAFVAELNPAGTALLYSTYLGGSANDFGNAIAVDPGGDVYVAGDTLSPNFPLGSRPLQGALRGTSDAFVAKLSASGAAATKTVLTSSPNPSASGQNLTFTATISVMGGSGTPTGTVTFSDNGMPLTCSGGNQMVSVGQATCQSAFGTSGLHSLTAAYSGDSSFAASTSAPLEQVVKQFASSTSLISSSPSSAFGQSVTFTANVAGVGSGATVPGGRVVFQDGANALATVMLDTSGSAVLMTSGLTAGVHSISAAYGGDANFAGSISSSVSQNVLWPGSLTGPPFLTTIPVGNGPAAMVLNPATNRIYVANRMSNNVTVIDAGAYVVVTTIAVGQGPVAIAVNTQTNTIYTADYDSSSVTVIDGATNTVIKRVSAPLAPVAISVDEQNNQIFVGSATAGGTFAIIDGATDSVNYITYLGGPIAFASSLLSDRTYVAFSQDSDIGAYEGITGVRLGDFSKGFISPVALAADAGKIFAADTTGTLDTIDEAMGTFTRQPVGNSSVSLSITVPGGPDNQLSVGHFTGDLGVTYASTGLPFNPTNILTLSTTIPAPPINNFRQDFGVHYTDTGLPFERVNSLDCAFVPTRQYTLTVGSQDVATYTFCSGDAGRSITISYGAILLQGQYFGSTGLYTFSPADVGAAIVINYNATNSPYALAVNARDARVYLANQSPAPGVAASVAVSNAGPGGTFKSVPVGTNTGQIPAPSKIVTDESRDLIYVANDASNDVSIIDGQTVGLITNVPVGVAPSALVRDPFSCDMFAANAGSGTVTVVSPLIIGPAVCLSRTSLAFGSQAVGTTRAAQSVVLTNIGTADLLISSVAPTGDFAVAGDCLPIPPATSVILHVRQACTMPVTFTPTAFGIRTGQITITDNAPGNPQTIELSGDGAARVTVQLTVNPNPVVYGQFPALTAKVAPQVQGEPIPTGSVTFLLDGQTKLGNQLLDSTGSATLQYPSIPFQFPVGSQHTLTAQYNRDPNYSPAASPAVNLVITKAPTFISADVLTSTTPNQLEVFVSPLSSGNGIPTGTVTLQDGQNTFASITLGVNYGEGYGATPVLRLPPGLHHIVAQYQGDGNFLPSTSQPTNFTVLAQTVTTATSSAPTVVAGNGVSFTATVTAQPQVPGTGIFGTIIFRDGQTVISNATATVGSSGTVTTPLFATGPGSGFNVGQHSITAEYQDSSGGYLGSKSAPVVVTVSPAGGGTPNCACSLTGAYVAPATPVNPSSSTLSPHGKYTVAAAYDTSNRLSGATLSVTRNADQVAVFPMQNFPITMNFGFSPDDDRLVLHYLTGSIDNVYLYDLTVQPARLIVFAQSQSVTTSTALSFSPSGRYFMYEFLYVNGPSTIARIQIYQIQNVASQLLIYDSGDFFFVSVPGSGEDSFGALGQGFSPDNPETSFVYSYVTGQGQATGQSQSTWNLVSLVTPQKLPKKTITLADISDIWEYSPCGDVIGLIRQLQPNTTGTSTVAEVDLIATATGLALNPNGYQAATIQLLLNCTGSAQQVTDNSSQTPVVFTLAPNSGCSNTPTGANVIVSPLDLGGSGLAPVTITFNNVTVPGATTLVGTSSGPPPPPNTKPGTPAKYFDVSTTATFSSATVCISYADLAFGSSSIILLHNKNGAWEIPPNQTVDTTHQTICATVTSFSPFIIVELASSPTLSSISAPSVVYGTPASVTVSVSSSSATVTGAVTLSVDGGAAVSIPLANGSAIFNLGVLSAGNHSLSANFAAQGSFAASTANGTLVVNPAPFTLMANSFSMAYGAPLPNLTFSASGFVNGDTAASLSTQPTLSTTATAASRVGNYPISISGAVDPNYSIAYAQGTLTVTPVQLTITANSVSKVYGAALPTLGFSASGFVNGDTNASLTTQPTLSTAATAVSGVGNYPMSISSAVDPNYSITYVQGTLTVTPAALTVTGANAQRVYGAASPVLTGAITGIQNGDNISAIYATVATPTSPVGMYAIVPTLVDPGGKRGNYIVTLVNGVLTVIQGSTTTVLSASPDPSNFGQSVTLAATVAPVVPVAGTATGKVTFFDGSTTLGTSTLGSTDTATLTTSALAAGNHSLTASYSGDPNFSGSSSSAVSDQVRCGVLISLSPSTVALGGTVTVSGKVISCSTTTQMVVVKFSLSGPSQPNSCSSTKSEMFTTPPFPLPPKTAQTVSFPFKVPSKGVCPGTYSITATTLVNGVVVDASTASLTITAH
jgi:YVTN family beta-propeller protein